MVTENNYPDPDKNPFMDALAKREAWRSKPYDEAFDSLRYKLRTFIDSGAAITFRKDDLLTRIKDGTELRTGMGFEELTTSDFTVAHRKPLLARRWAFNISRRPWMGVWSRMTRDLFEFWQFAVIWLVLCILGFYLSLQLRSFLLCILTIPCALLLSVLATCIIVRDKRERLKPAQTKRIGELAELVELVTGLGYEAKVILEQKGKPNELCVEVWVRYTKKVYLNATHDETLN
jgi:hypothetical protein